MEGKREVKRQHQRDTSHTPSWWDRSQSIGSPHLFLHSGGLRNINIEDWFVVRATSDLKDGRGVIHILRRMAAASDDGNRNLCRSNQHPSPQAEDSCTVNRLLSLTIVEQQADSVQHPQPYKRLSWRKSWRVVRGLWDLNSVVSSIPLKRRVWAGRSGGRVAYDRVRGVSVGSTVDACETSPISGDHVFDGEYQYYSSDQPRSHRASVQIVRDGIPRPFFPWRCFRPLNRGG